MAEQRHQGLQAHTGVDQAGGVGVAQLVRGDVQRRAARSSQAGGGDRGGEHKSPAPWPVSLVSGRH